MSFSAQIMSPREEAELDRAVALLARGGVVALPTDTLYGLAADAFSEVALGRIYAIKGRPAALALPLLVAGIDQLPSVTASVSPRAARLAETFWPGPLTLVLPASPRLSPLVTAGRDTVAVRWPDHPVPQVLARRLGRPITGTSANRSGQPDLLDLTSLRRELGDSVDYIIRTGPAPAGVASTVVDLSSDAPTLLREGALPFDRVLAALGDSPGRDRTPVV